MKYFLGFAVVIFTNNYIFAAKNLEEIKEYDATSIKKIDVNIGSAELKISGEERTSVQLKIIWKQKKEECVISHKIEKNKLLIVQESQHKISYQSCRVSIELLTPRSMDLELETGSGAIKTKNIAGNIDFDSGSGDVSLEGELNSVEGNTGSGSIDLRGVRGEIDVETGSGGIFCKLDKAAKADTKMKFETGSGDVIIEAPSSLKFDTKFKTGSGKIRNDFENIPVENRGKIRLVVQTGSGDITINKRD